VESSPAARTMSFPASGRTSMPAKGLAIQPSRSAGIPSYSPPRRTRISTAFESLSMVQTSGTPIRAQKGSFSRLSSPGLAISMMRSGGHLRGLYLKFPLDYNPPP
jgi:hypothetical protein